MSTSNGKRMQTNMRMKDNQSLPPVPQHEELIKFILDSWNKVCQEYQKGNAQGTPTVAYHTETDPNPMLENFVPFDLEAWWGKKVVQNITQNS
ncbi:MAPK regulated corepressor interacting protein 2 [Halyomorpha halys]|uniref:MAPK regulated corepressor interacting protein 2 n=1 Tax=Halyomorpha halys TaxID=286706 RepID=UPI0006D519B2|nr:MAPK regulated corepressor interacting protein 2-like [Halyomorpha halys]